MSEVTHDEKVLALLSDGLPHTHHEIYALRVIGHSRVASLRRKGHNISSWRDGDDYLYQLVPLGESSAPARWGEPLCADDSPSGGQAVDLLDVSGDLALTPDPAQLSIDDALVAA